MDEHLLPHAWTTVQGRGCLRRAKARRARGRCLPPGPTLAFFPYYPSFVGVLAACRFLHSESFSERGRHTSPPCVGTRPPELWIHMASQLSHPLIIPLPPQPPNRTIFRMPPHRGQVLPMRNFSSETMDTDSLLSA